MKNNFLQEIFVSSIMIILLVLLINPFDFWMPNSFLITIIFWLIIAFSIFSIFIWKEHIQDEREESHRAFAGRVGFIVGSGILLLGIILQCFQHNLDIWLVITLIAMILAKIVGLIYSRARH